VVGSFQPPSRQGARQNDRFFRKTFDAVISATTCDRR
jgi:hypothetical protein